MLQTHGSARRPETSAAARLAPDLQIPCPVHSIPNPWDRRPFLSHLVPGAWVPPRLMTRKAVSQSQADCLVVSLCFFYPFFFLSFFAFSRNSQTHKWHRPPLPWHPTTTCLAHCQPTSTTYSSTVVALIESCLLAISPCSASFALENSLYPPLQSCAQLRQTFSLF